MFEKFKRQFIVPKGLLGKAAGKIMLMENKKINEWTLNNLSIRPGDLVLEIGYGPGYALKLITEKIPNAQIEGVDLSEAMQAEAKNNNEEAIRAGNIKLMKGDVSELHASDEKYDRIFSVNNYPLWDEPAETLKVIASSLKKGGTIAITVQPREDGVTDETTIQLGSQIKKDLQYAGFTGIKIQYKKVRPVLTVCATAKKPL